MLYLFNAGPLDRGLDELWYENGFKKIYRFPEKYPIKIRKILDDNREEWRKKSPRTMLINDGIACKNNQPINVYEEVNNPWVCGNGYFPLISLGAIFTKMPESSSSKPVGPKKKDRKGAFWNFRKFKVFFNNLSSNFFYRAKT